MGSEVAQDTKKYGRKGALRAVAQSCKLCTRSDPARTQRAEPQLAVTAGRQC